MQNPPADLPDNIAELKAIIARQADEFMAVRHSLADELTASRQELAAARSGLQLRALEIEKLKLTIARLRKMAFGKSSEKIHREIAQLELSLEELESEVPTDFDDDAGSPVNDEMAKPEKRKRRALPDHLPREEVRHEPQGNCAQCGGTLKQVGEDVTEILDYVPGHFKVIRHVRPALSCRSCESMVQSPMPSLPIERGMPSANLLAHVLVSKYADHLPLYRQSGIYARDGMELPRSLLANWVGKCANLMQPLIDAIERHVLAGSHLHADDTPVPVLDPGRGKTRQGRLWIYLRDERPHGSDMPPAALYRYSPDRKGLYPQTVLKDFTGHLHADGYAGFNKLYGPGNQLVREVACWAHVRHKIYDVYEKTVSGASGPPIFLLRFQAAIMFRCRAYGFR
jgi:transposase